MKNGFVIFGSFLVALTAVTGAVHAAEPAGAQTTEPIEMVNLGEDRFTLQVTPPRDAKAGEQAKASIKITPADGYHMNADYPTSLSLEAPAGVTLAKAKLKKADLKGFDEHKGGTFEVELTADRAGRHTVTGKLKFAICNESSCSPVSETVTINVSAQ